MSLVSLSVVWCVYKNSMVIMFVVLLLFYMLYHPLGGVLVGTAASVIWVMSEVRHFFLIMSCVFTLCYILVACYFDKGSSI